jgi:hypothetical protein
VARERTRRSALPRRRLKSARQEMDLYYAGEPPEEEPLHGSPYPPPVAYRRDHEPEFVEAPPPMFSSSTSSTTTTQTAPVVVPRRSRAWIWVVVIVVIVLVLIAVGVYLYYDLEIKKLGAGSACTSSSRCASGACTGGTCT